MSRTSKTKIKVTTNIVHGTFTSAQKQAWKSLWQKLISDSTDEASGWKE
jgi:hypothetical protein